MKVSCGLRNLNTYRAAATLKEVRQAEETSDPGGGGPNRRQGDLEDSGRESG
jgi:hypothetical protein